MKEEFTTITHRGLNLEGIEDSGIDDSLAKSMGLTEEELEKADVKQAFSDSYGDKQIKIGKTGKEIKVGLTAKKAEYSNKKQILEDKKVHILHELKELGVKDGPDKVPYYAENEDYADHKEFSWEIQDKHRIPHHVAKQLKEGGSEDEVAQNQMMGSTKTLSNEDKLKYLKCEKISKYLKEYNDHARACFNTYKDLAVIETMLNNFKDGTTYQLTVKQLQAAGL